MNAKRKTKAQLIAELAEVRQRMRQLETAEAERQQAEKALRESEAHANAMLRAIPDLMFRMDRQGVFLDYKAELNDLFAQSEPTLIGKRNRDVTPPEFADLIDLKIHTSLMTGALQTFEYQLPIPGQGVRDYEARMAASGADEVTAIVRDITKRKRTEEALRESEALYHSLVEVIPQSLCRKDLTGRFTFGNHLFCAGLHLSLAELIGKDDFDIHPPDLAEKYRRDDRRVIETGQIFETIEERALIGGQPAYTHTIKAPIRDGSGQITGIQIMFWDVTDRVQAEEALGRLAAIVDSSGDAIISMALDGIITSWNRGAEGVYGYTESEVIGQPISILAPPDRADEMPQILEKIKVGSHVDHFETVRRRKDGQPIHVSLSVSPIRNAEGRIIAASSIGRDNTERKRVEEALHASEERYRELVENANDIVYTLDLAGNFTSVNRAAERITGYTHQEILALNLAQVTSPDDFALARQMLQSKVTTGQPTTYPLEVYAKDGHKVSLELSTRLIYQAGQLVGSQGIARDITERRQAEEAEREQHELAEALRDTAAALASTLRFEEVLDQVLLNVKRVVPHDAVGIMLLDASRETVRLVRYRSTIASGQPAEVERLRFRVAETPNLRTILASGQPLIVSDTRTFEGWVTTPYTTWIRSNVNVPIKIYNHIIGFLSLDSERPNAFKAADADRLRAFADQAATAIHNAQLYEQVQQHAAELERRVADRTHELAAANQRLTELDRMKDEFVSRISHELRTPLANIKLYLGLLDHGKPEKHDQYMDTLSREATRLQQLIENLLRISQLEIEADDIHLAPIDVNQLLAQFVIDRSGLARDQGLRIESQLTPDLPSVLADATLLMQALSNLMTNATNYTLAGGTITLSTALQSSDDQAWVTCTIHDTGPGISAKDLPHIFERFYRGEAAKDYTLPGTGLGLSICQEIVEKMGGRITVESQPNHGAAFTVWLKTAD